MGFGGGSSSSSSNPLPAGGGVGTGALNAAFGLDQSIQNGQFVLTQPKTPKDIEAKRQQAAREAGAAAREKAEISGSNLPSDRYDTIERQATAQYLKDNPVLASSSGNFNQGPFGEGTPGFDLVSNLLSGITDPVKFEQQFLDFVNQSNEAQRDIFGKSAKALADLISSGGNPTDVSALVSQGVEQLKEQFSTSGAGLFSSDVQSGAVRLGSQLNIQAQEAAQARLLNALGLGQTFAQSGQSFASNLGNLGLQHEGLFTTGGRSRQAFLRAFQPQSTNIFSIGTDQKSNAFDFNVGLD